MARGRSSGRSSGCCRNRARWRWPRGSNRGALAVLHTDRLGDCTLYVTLEPCAQCAGAIVLAKLGRLVFGAYDDKAGMAGSVGDLVRHRSLNHRVEVIGGVREEECGALLRAFFAERR